MQTDDESYCCQEIKKTNVIMIQGKSNFKYFGDLCYVLGQCVMQQSMVEKLLNPTVLEVNLNILYEVAREDKSRAHKQYIPMFGRII